MALSITGVCAALAEPGPAAFAIYPNDITNINPHHFSKKLDFPEEKNLILKKALYPSIHRKSTLLNSS
ncbi:hypothetical protein L0152_15820, partial [bacterium]|nr:hypothetical protein [bacterium]